MSKYKVFCAKPGCPVYSLDDDFETARSLVARHRRVSHAEEYDTLPCMEFVEIPDEPGAQVIAEAEAVAAARWAVTTPAPIYPERHPEVQRRYRAFLDAELTMVLHPGDATAEGLAQLAYNMLDDIAPQLAMQHESPRRMAKLL